MNHKYIGFKTKEKDLLYIDNEYKVYKKDSGETGTFLPIDLLILMDIVVGELGEWENGGFANQQEYKKIIVGIIKKLAELPN